MGIYVRPQRNCITRGAMMMSTRLRALAQHIADLEIAAYLMDDGSEEQAEAWQHIDNLRELGEED